ncbi:YitT family protein [Aeromonas simiae]|uniref:YitT family protein n=1 Tax=Aeromonas simiae TaxID=218936 RepID=UPI0005AA244C|nr:YitT family protein [Aeromonas simiae]MDO2947497.1 YitT family protein [Aeromonas simiae]MDO2951589.1 YitT family protein [Aeromonas simiae]MDO2955057.1 YitT family protein [Aeromonas simiae]
MDNRPHPLYEDALALLTASGFVSLGIFLFHQVGLLTGGTAGLALLLQQITGVSFGLLFFGINLPFYALAWLRMGPRFTLNTFLSVAAVSWMTDHLNAVLLIGKVEPLYAALIGGSLIGMGLLIMFRHRSSLGGFNILALFIQERVGIRAGKLQMGLDCAIVIASFFVVSPWLLLLSIVAAIFCNLVLTLNHKPGRYQVA